MKTLVSMRYGSHLYGTDTPESDVDIKGVFLPSYEDLLLARAPKHRSSTTGDDRSKNSSSDVDEEFFSLHYFLELACVGETVAIDMLHAPHEMTLESSPLWWALVSHRSKFYTKNLKAFVGYARRQAAKYGIKGSRLASARAVLAAMERTPQFDSFHAPARMIDLKTWLEQNPLEHVYVDADWVQVCGKKLQWSARISEYLSTMRKFVAEYGGRARQAEQNDGVDWKAMSHALRAAFEVRSILTVGDLFFPLPQAPYLKEVKKGLLPFADVAARLEAEMDELEKIADRSSLPESVDREWVDGWLLDRLYWEYGIIC